MRPPQRGTIFDIRTGTIVCRISCTGGTYRGACAAADLRGYEQSIVYRISYIGSVHSIRTQHAFTGFVHRIRTQDMPTHYPTVPTCHYWARVPGPGLALFPALICAWVCARHYYGISYGTPYTASEATIVPKRADLLASDATLAACSLAPGSSLCFRRLTDSSLSRVCRQNPEPYVV